MQWERVRSQNENPCWVSIVGQVLLFGSSTLEATSNEQAKISSCHTVPSPAWSNVAEGRHPDVAIRFGGLSDLKASGSAKQQ